MKKKILMLITVFSVVLLSGCQSMTKDFGGTTTIDLPPNTKLEEITWKDANLWYLTRPMGDDDIAEIHTFQESSEFGLIEGKVIIIEHKED